jgi:tetraacyldisaccharide 4'-kinase
MKLFKEAVRNRLFLFWGSLIKGQEIKKSWVGRAIYTFFLVPMSWIYACAVAFRHLLYDQKILKVESISIPVISIGNLGLGGAGKTPYTLFLAKELMRQGHRVAILTRGYGRQSRQAIYWHPDSMGALPDAALVGDEPLELMRELSDVHYLIGSNRVLSAHEAVARGATVALLDDGMQHRALARQEEIVVIDLSRMLPWEDRPIPAGGLRDLVSRLSVATKVVLTRWEDRSKADLQEIMTKIWSYRPIPVELLKMAPGSFLQWKDKRWHHDQLENLQGCSVVALAGIGNPDPFFKMVKALVKSVAKELIYADHCDYLSLEVGKELEHLVNEHGAECIICTCKDLMKLKEIGLKVPCYALSLNLSVIPYSSAQ